MTTYTKEIENQTFFLNDKNIAQGLSDEIAINAIPSLNLLNTVNNDLKRNISSEENRANQKEQTLSNNIETENKRAISVETQISNALTAENKRAISAENTLDQKINTLSTDLSTTVNNDYVHKAGDTIDHLSVTTDLLIKRNVTLATEEESKVKIQGGLIHGKNSQINDKVVGGIALGVNANVSSDDSFTWNGNTDDHDYTSHNTGSFNINPMSGVKGVYIGEETLSDIIHNDVETSANSILNTINSVSTTLLNNLSDEINRANTAEQYLSAVLSTEVDNRISADKLLSNILSTYTNVEISTLCTNLSNTVNENYVHISGDTINGLSVKSNLSVENAAKFDKTAEIQGNLIQGKNSNVVSSVNGVALGVNANVSNDNSFVWNSNAAASALYSSNSNGSFNINPVNGVNGVYIGNDSLCSIISNEVNISTVSVLNTIKTTKDNLSNEISTAKFACIDKCDFNYDDNAHVLSINLTDKYTNYSKILSVDTTMFIKNQIVDSVEVKTVDNKKYLRIHWRKDALGGASIYTDIPIDDLVKIYTGGNGIEIADDLKISVVNYNQLTANLSQTSSSVNDLLNDSIPVLSTRISALETYKDDLSKDQGIIPTLCSNIKTLSGSVESNETAINTHQYYIESLSSSNNGMLTNISAHLSGVDNNISYLSNKIDENKISIDTNATNITKHQEYIDSLSTVGGVFPTIENNISAIRSSIKSLTNLSGTIEFNKDNPSWRTPDRDNTLSTMFKYFVFEGNETPIKNGTMFQIKLITDNDINFDQLSNAISAYYDFDKSETSFPDGLRLSHKDYVVIKGIKSSEDEYIQLSDLTIENVKILAGAKFYEAKQNEYDISVLSAKLSVEIARAISTETEITNNLNTEIADRKTNDSNISAKVDNKLFIDGVSADTLSAIHISQDDFYQKVLNNEILSNELYVVSGDYINAYDQQIKNLKAPTDNSDATTKQYVDTISNALSNEISTNVNTLTTSLSTISSNLCSEITASNSNISTLSTEVSTISTNLSNALTAEIADRKTNDANISTKVDNKLFIDGVSAESLSAFHISQDEYHQKVIDGKILSNELYIVSSDYTNMYDEQIKNLAEPTDNSDATTKQYVDTLTNNISGSVDTLSDTLISNINTVSTYLHDELKDLSTAISGKIYIVDANDTSATSSVNSLSIVDISQEDYHTLVAESAIAEDALYIVSSDYLHMYDEQIKNLAEPTDDADATTKNYVDNCDADTLSTAKNYVNSCLSNYATNSSVSSTYITKTEVSTLSASILSNIDAVSTALSNDITATYLKKTDAANTYVTKSEYNTLSSKYDELLQTVNTLCSIVSGLSATT